MQQLKYITIIAIAAISFGSCKKDYLALYPEGQINGANFYKTETDFQEALVGAYVPLREAAAVAFYMEEMRSDNTEYDYNSKDRGGLGYEQLADFMDDKSNGVTSTLWAAGFKGIQRTDIILDRLEKIDTTVVSTAARNQITGEAKALRAHYYFELVRCFGRLPLYLHEVTDSKNAFVSSTSVDSVYDQIIADFTAALALIPPPAKFPQSGRITKGMVATELGLVYLTRKAYDKAIPLFQLVTTMGYDLLPVYADVFRLGNKNSRESIFEIQYKAGTDGQSSLFIYRFLPYTKHTKNILGVDYNNTLGGWNVPTDDLISAYEAKDTRLDASIGIIKGKLDANTDFQPDSVGSILSPPTPGELSKKIVKKQFQPQGYSIINNTEDNWPVYRYSDVLLMLAECLNEQNQPGAALPFLNRVRTRAGLAASAETDQAALRAVIAHERRVELAFENHRWFDLVRTAQAIPVMTAFGIAQKAKYGYLLPASYTVTANRLIYAIPFRESQVNPGLGQNPGYQ